MTISVPTTFECLADLIPSAKVTTSVFGTYSQQRAPGDEGNFIFKFQVTDAQKTVITGYEWRLYQDDHVAGTLGSFELAGEESATVDTQEFKYFTASTLDIVLQIMHPNYEENIIKLTLTGEAINMLVVMIKEEDF